MTEIRKTEIFAKWLDGLDDIRARARIQARIERLATGNPGDAKPVGEGVSELRIDYGPGYRVYYTWVERLSVHGSRLKRHNYLLRKARCAARCKRTLSPNG